MNPKKVFSVLLISLCVTFVMPSYASATNPIPLKETPKEILKAKIETRLIEIKSMDKSELSATEKRELRKEVKDLKRTAKENGIYLSVGAIIIIILLLILIL